MTTQNVEEWGETTLTGNEEFPTTADAGKLFLTAQYTAKDDFVPKLEFGSDQFDAGLAGNRLYISTLNKFVNGDSQSRGSCHIVWIRIK